MQECGRDGGLPNEDERLAVYVDETSGVYEVAGSHGHSKTNSCSWLSRVVLVHAHRPPYDLASRGLGQLDRQGGDVRHVGLARWQVVIVAANGGRLLGGGEFSSLIHDAHHALIWF